VLLILKQALIKTFSLFLATIVFSVTLIFLTMWVMGFGGSRITQKVISITDIVLSVPFIVLVPLIVLIVPDLQAKGASDFVKILIGGGLLSIRFSAMSVQVLINSIQRLQIEPFARTWIAMGGNQISLIFYWLRGLILAPWIQVLPGFLVQTLTGSVLIETLFGYQGLGSLFIESIHSRDWAILRPYLVWTSILFFVCQIGADFFQRYFDPRLIDTHEKN